MKIAIIFPRFTGPYGGERLLVNLANSLKVRGNLISIFTHKKAPYVDTAIRDLDLREGYFPNIKNHKISNVLDLFLMPLLISKIRGQFDLVIAVGWQSTFGAFLFKTIKGGKQKTIYYCLEPPRIAYDLKDNVLANEHAIKSGLLLMVNPLIRYIDKLSVNSFDHIISISDWTAREVKKIYNRSSTIIYPGIEMGRFDGITRNEARKKLKIQSKDKVFLSVSKLHKRKRLDLAIKVFQKRKDKNSLFFIIGDGPDRKNVIDAIEKTKLESIMVLGELSDEEIALYMKAANYFIFTAKNEPFGIAPLEAKFAGCKVIPFEPKYTPADWKTVATKSLGVFNDVLIKGRNN